MDIYWVLEYVKVLGAYIFLMFIWPSVVFRKFLEGKKIIYRFNFCVTSQIVIVNTVVLTSGFLKILNDRVIVYLFFGAFLVSICNMNWVKELYDHLDNYKENLQKFQNYKENTIGQIQKFWKAFCMKKGEYILLSIIVVFGMVYFTYGAFEVHSYGQPDMFLHHAWVNNLTDGKIFPDGIYPEAMHCFIYCLNALFGIRIHSIILFIQCIHIMVLLLSAYSLLREVFSWRYTPFLVLGLYVIIDFKFVYSMSRLQTTLPLEFGLYTQFLCALYFIRYLKNAGYISRKGKLTRYCWDENLLLFMMSLSASIVTHFYATIMAFIVCMSFALFRIKIIFLKKYFIPITLSVLCGCIIALTPMATAAISGITFQDSIYWGLNSIENTDKNRAQDYIPEAIGSSLEFTKEDLNIIEELPDVGKKIAKCAIKIEYLIRGIYKSGYLEMYGDKAGKYILGISVAVIVICLIERKRSKIVLWRITKEYPPIILISFLVIFIFAAYNNPNLKLPVLIADHRFCSSGHIMILAVIIMPMDIIFSLGKIFLKEKIVQMISIASTLSIYIFANLYGNFHGYLYYVLMQYSAAVEVTNSIIDEFPKDSYTIISPIEDSYQIFPYGKHEEIAAFLEKTKDKYYTIPTEHVFVYVEKKPIVLEQIYYFNGPLWLGKGEESEIEHTEISEEAAKQDVSKLDLWSLYREGRTTLESKAYEWCQHFEKLHPSEMKIYYEDEEFICYYFHQKNDLPFDLRI